MTEQEWAGGKLLRHIGSNNFWLAEATLAPGKDLAVLLVTNVSDDAVEAPFKELLAALIADHAAHQMSAGPVDSQTPRSKHAANRSSR